MKTLIDLRTLAEVQEAAPRVTKVSLDMAMVVLRAMEAFAEQNPAQIDIRGARYWQTRFQHLRDLTGLSITEVAVGQALKAMGFERWRRFDGMYVAWSQAQIDILKRHLMLE
jgi:uncharacterized PurR-regulated membrane protein YhhQ (DUF165 family)